MGSLFGAVLGRAIDAWWRELGEPDSFTVVEAGAGRGTLARHVLAEEPDCGDAMRYVLVERSAALRDHHGGLGSRVTSVPELPAVPITGVVVANELLDNLPFLIVERTAGGWAEVRIGAQGDDLVEVLVPAADELATGADLCGGALPVGARIPIQRAARQWVCDALAVIERGRLVVFDYGAPTMELGVRGGWLRTYRGHARGSDPLAAPGELDITTDVAIDQLPAPSSVQTQADFLAAHGIDALVAEARSAWDAAAARPDLAAFKARARITEAATLTDPTGLGAFLTLEWHKP